MNRKQPRLKSKDKGKPGYDYTQDRTQQMRFVERQENFAWSREIRKILSPYWAASSASLPL